MSKFVATAYGPPWNAMQGTGVTSRGVDLRDGKQKLVVAVDPRVIPYGTKLKIWPNPFGDRNLVFTASDTGGAIKGSRIDFFVASGRKAQNAFGKKSVSVTRVGSGNSKNPGVLSGLGTRGVSPGSTKATLERTVTKDSRDARRAAMAQYIQRRGHGKKGQSFLQLQSELSQIPADQPSVNQQPSKETAGGGGLASSKSRLLELFYDPIGGWQGKQNIGPIGGHGDHVHVAAGPKTTVALGNRAEQMGLRVSGHKAFTGVRPTSGHVPDSNHYKDEAIDVSGTPKKMAAYANFVKSLYQLR